MTLLLARRLKHLAGDMEYLDELQAALTELERTGQAAQPAPAPVAEPERTDEKRARVTDDKRARVRLSAATRRRSAHP